MQTSSELQDIHKSVSLLLESCAHALCLVPSFVLCMDFYWNSSVRTKTAGAAEVIYKKMCMLLTSHREREREMKWTMRWSAPQTESLTSSRRRQTRTLKKCWKFYSYSCGSHTHTHPPTGDVYIHMQYANSKHTDRHEHTHIHTVAHMIAWQNCPYTLPSGGCLPTTTSTQPSPTWCCTARHLPVQHLQKCT